MSGTGDADRCCYKSKASYVQVRNNFGGLVRTEFVFLHPYPRIQYEMFKEREGKNISVGEFQIRICKVYILLEWKEAIWQSVNVNLCDQ